MRAPEEACRTEKKALPVSSRGVCRNRGSYEVNMSPQGILNEGTYREGGTRYWAKADLGKSLLDLRSCDQSGESKTREK